MLPFVARVSLYVFLFLIFFEMSVSLNRNTILQTSTYIQVLLVSLGPVNTTANMKIKLVTSVFVTVYIYCER